MVLSTFMMFVPQHVEFIFFVLLCVGFFGIYVPWNERKKKKNAQHKTTARPSGGPRGEERGNCSLTSTRAWRIYKKVSKGIKWALTVLIGGASVLTGLTVLIPAFGTFGLLLTVVFAGVAVACIWFPFGSLTGLALWLVEKKQRFQEVSMKRKTTFRFDEFQGMYTLSAGGVLAVIGLLVLAYIFGVFGVLGLLLAVGYAANGKYGEKVREILRKLFLKPKNSNGQAFGRCRPEIIEDERNTPPVETHDHIPSTALDSRRRLEQLKTLKEAGLLDEREYRERREKILRS